MFIEVFLIAALADVQGGEHDGTFLIIERSESITDCRNTINDLNALFDAELPLDCHIHKSPEVPL